MADQISAKTPSRLRISLSQIDTRAFLAGLTLAIFVISAAISGFCISVAAGFGALALASLVATYFLGASQ